MTERNENFKQYKHDYLTSDQLDLLRELMKVAAADEVDSLLDVLHDEADGDFPVIDQAAYDKIVREVYESVYEPFTTPSFDSMSNDALQTTRYLLDDLQ